MDTLEKARTQDLQAALLRTKEQYQLTGLALAVAYGKGKGQTMVVGTDEKGVPLAQDSLFPIASITKLAVALAVLRLSDRGLLSIHDPLGKFVDDVVAASAGVTLRQLLTHTAGLPEFPADAWTYDASLNWQIQAQACLKIASTAPGSQVSYSNADYGLLAIVVERLTDLPYRDAVIDLVIRPLGIEAYLGSEPPRLPAYTLDLPDKHAGTPLETWNSPFWRGLGAPWGGMVTTPAGSLALLRAYQGLPEGFLRPETVRTASQDQTGGLGGGFPWQTWAACPWGLGPWIIAENMNHFAFANANPGTLCHTGYSGCAVYYDPTVDVSWAIRGTVSAADDRLLQACAMLSEAIIGSNVR